MTKQLRSCLLDHKLAPSSGIPSRGASRCIVVAVGSAVETRAEVVGASAVVVAEAVRVVEIHKAI